MIWPSIPGKRCFYYMCRADLQHSGRVKYRFAFYQPALVTCICCGKDGRHCVQGGAFSNGGGLDQTVGSWVHL